jgi:hypothetical protein
VLLSREILTTTVEVNASGTTVPFHSGAVLHPKIVKQVLETIEQAGRSAATDE